jgi:SnoaL-like domain
MEIASLPIRYARAADSRDLEGLVGLFVPDVPAGPGRQGRAALREVLESSLRMFYRSVHYVCGHVIDELDDDHARGTTYCRAEQEVRDRWIVSAVMYQDSYERRDGHWLFSRRLPRLWYAADMLERPSDVGLNSWPEMAQFPVTLPGKFGTWQPFWDAGSGPAPSLLPLPGGSS